MTVEPTLGEPVPRPRGKKDPLKELYQDLTNGRYKPKFTRPQRVGMSEHKAALTVALAKGRMVLEQAIIKAASEEHMGRLIQYCRDLNIITVLQWKYAQQRK